MEKSTQQNTIQDSFLNSARKERSNVTIYLMSGVKLTGRIKSFDKYSVILEAGSQEQLIFKHAISTVSLPRGGGRDYYQSRPAYGGERGERPERPEREHHTEREHHAEQATGTQANTAGGQEKS
jgi:host factor-I protein